MSKILVPPEVLLSVSEQFNRASNQLEANSNMLNQHIQMLASCWDGTTCSRFYYDFQQAYRDMKLTIEHMQVTSQELKKIAYKFMQVDNEQGNLDPRCASPQTLNSLGMSNVHYEKAIKEKSFGDHVNELGMEFKAFGVGVQAAAAEVWDSAKDTANALIEEPVETGKQMAYNATIGTAEEIVKTTIWGAKMALDIGDTREKFGEEVQAEQELINEMGTSTYLGQQAAMIFGGFALKRLGVKDTPNLKKDSGGDGGKGGAGTGDGGTKLTEPSLPNGGKPKGHYTKGDSHGVKKENETANIFANQGYDIEMLDEVNGGNGRGIKNTSNPDFLIEGEVFDCYAPTIDTNVDNILRNIRTKTKTQAERIVLNLDGFTPEKITEVTEGILRKANPNGDLKNLQELLIVVDGKITRIFGG